MARKVLLYAKRDAPEAKSRLAEVSAWLKKQKVDVIDATKTEAPLKAKALAGVVLAVVFGGDGTFLRLVRRLEKKDQFPVLGVNLGTVGFITDVQPENAVAAVADALAGKYPESPRPLLLVELFRGKKRAAQGYVFNDAVLTKDAKTSMLKFEVKVGNETLSHVRADGYIVSTATGSTAYSLSASGPLMFPDVPANVLVAICSHALSSRPMVVSDSVPIEIRPTQFDGAVYLVFDGQINHEIQPGDHIRITRSPAALRLVRSPALSWVRALRTKLDMA